MHACFSPSACTCNMTTAARDYCCAMIYYVISTWSLSNFSHIIWAILATCHLVTLPLVVIAAPPTAVLQCYLEARKGCVIENKPRTCLKFIWFYLYVDYLGTTYGQTLTLSVSWIAPQRHLRAKVDVSYFRLGLATLHNGPQGTKSVQNIHNTKLNFLKF